MRVIERGEKRLEEIKRLNAATAAIVGRFSPDPWHDLTINYGPGYKARGHPEDTLRIAGRKRTTLHAHSRTLDHTLYSPPSPSLPTEPEPKHRRSHR